MNHAARVLMVVMCGVCAACGDGFVGDFCSLDGTCRDGGNSPAPKGGGDGVGGGRASGGGVSGVGGGNSAGGGSSGGGVSGAGGGSNVGGGSNTGGGSSVGGGSSAGGGHSGVGGGSQPEGGGSGGASRPCDIYADAGTPCVAAHSTVRALYAAYSGALYQVKKPDGSTKDIPVSEPGGFVDIAVQDSFCSGTTCTISILYDQSPQKNHLPKSPQALWLPNGGKESSATKGRITVSGHVAYGIYVTADEVAYRNNSTKGIATGDKAESMYMVVDGKRYSNNCCFDYGNAETNGKDNGNGTMEALYWGTDTTWGGKGDGNGPWLAADLENGMFKSDKGGWQTTSTSPNAKSIIANFASGFLKGPSGNHFTLKGGDAQSGKLVTTWDSVRPSPGYAPKKLEGAIILGTGGDGSKGGTGTFYEGAMTIGNPPDAVDDAIQANIIGAGYGK